jgi:glutaminyl-tRNA synthetase
MSKRLLTQLVDEGFVEGWNDPRLPTIAGLRRRGCTPEAIREFCARIGVTKADNLVEMAMLESAIREDLDRRAPRAMAVLRPLKMVIESYPEGRSEDLVVPNHPKDDALGTRTIAFAREVYIDRNDFMEQPVKGFKRLRPGGEVRLRNSYVVRCDRVIKDGAGEVIELRCTHDPHTLGRNPEGRKVPGVIHWVCVPHAVSAEVRLYDRLFQVPDPGAGGRNFLADLNPDSLRTLTHCFLEPGLAAATPGDRFQFEREGYFVADESSTPDKPVFNLTVTLRDSWGKRAVGQGE